METTQINLVPGQRATRLGDTPLPRPALRALLAHIIDYAGAFPPASLTCAEAFQNYRSYRRSSDGWLLGRFIITVRDLDTLAQEQTAPFAVLTNEDHPRAESIESKVFVQTAKPFYWECTADALGPAGAFAKFRTGGVTPDCIPDIDQLAAFLVRCAKLRLPFKVTAGLHHPLRSIQPLTYEPGAPKAILHGFINVFLAASFAWFGETNIEGLLAETDAAAFRFNERAHWRDWSLSLDQIRSVRYDFAHSFGSCSFVEPIEDLQKLGWL